MSLTTCECKKVWEVRTFGLSVNFIQDVCLYCQSDFGLSFGVRGTWPQAGVFREEASVKEDAFVKRFIK
jgi:hypothetical protein